jgi:PAS domain S-box-containing protein
VFIDRKSNDLLYMLKFFRKIKYDHEWLMAVRISGMFLVLGCLWILFSDRLVFSLFDDLQMQVRLQLWKGWFFVVVVAVMLLFMIKRYLSRNSRLSNSLALSEERFKSIIEKSVSGICITDENGVFEYVNPAYQEIYGYPARELIGKKITKLLKPELHETAIRSHRDLFHNKSGGRGLWDVIDSRGTPKKVMVDSLPVIWINGEKRMVTFVSDVTRQVRAEKELKNNEARYRSMMEALDIPLFITENDCRIIFANKAFREDFGEIDDETFCYRRIRGQYSHCSWCKDVHELKPGERYVEGFRSEVNDRIYQATMVPVEFNPGELQKMVILRDLTDILSAKERAEESDRLKTAFLANMSHEVRTPLNAILGFSSILNDDTLPSEERTRFIDLIHQSGIQLLNIIDDIVDVARIEQGNLRISIAPVELQPLLSEVMDIMKLELVDGTKPDLTLEMVNHLPPGFHINADSLRLKQVLMNLIGNAIKFTKKGKVILEVFRDGKDIVFNVEDTGMGIPQEKMDIIFERFRQVDESSTRVAGGNGLGLFISKNLVEQMGGKIKVASSYGKGSTFSVILKGT